MVVRLSAISRTGVPAANQGLVQHLQHPDASSDPNVTRPRKASPAVWNTRSIVISLFRLSIGWRRAQKPIGIVTPWPPSLVAPSSSTRRATWDNTRIESWALIVVSCISIRLREAGAVSGPVRSTPNAIFIAVAWDACTIDWSRPSKSKLGC